MVAVPGPAHAQEARISTPRRRGGRIEGPAPLDGYFGTGILAFAALFVIGKRPAAEASLDGPQDGEER